MNDETEHLKRPQHLATKAACRHWAPIVPLGDVRENGNSPPAKQPVPAVPLIEKTAD